MAILVITVFSQIKEREAKMEFKVFGGEVAATHLMTAQKEAVGKIAQKITSRFQDEGEELPSMICLLYPPDLVQMCKVVTKNRETQLLSADDVAVEIWVNLPAELLRWVGKTGIYFDQTWRELCKKREWSCDDLVLDGVGSFQMDEQKWKELLALVIVMQAWDEGKFKFWIEFHSIPCSLPIS